MLETVAFPKLPQAPQLKGCRAGSSSWPVGGVVRGGHYYQRPERLLHKALYVDSPNTICCMAALAGIGF
ncbi:hypothetical protein GLV81_10945 [Phnomibacter ginsenosidimutans]|uniref:Uncharacterized protein n=1 Tax=Phnomibacter ginsenosidimutans TaxID=2676868 RepID=A0A6I6GLM6_9BACT|nr:hypothetical protein GLV81_10945 [Phnomibacter ginsenosidimutans]